MTDPIQHLLDAGVINTTLFAPDSRYYGIATAKFTSPDGRTVAYIRRRFIPQAADYATLFEHTIVDGDREDLLAAKHLGSPLLSWQLCDANLVMDPAMLTRAPQVSDPLAPMPANSIPVRIRITLPAGVQASSHE